MPNPQISPKMEENYILYGAIFWIFLIFGFGYETNIAGMGELSKFHALASELLARTSRAASYCLPFNNQN